MEPTRKSLDLLSEVRLGRTLPSANMCIDQGGATQIGHSVLLLRISAQVSRPLRCHVGRRRLSDRLSSAATTWRRTCIVQTGWLLHRRGQPSFSAPLRSARPLRTRCTPHSYAVGQTAGRLPAGWRRSMGDLPGPRRHRWRRPLRRIIELGKSPQFVLPSSDIRAGDGSQDNGHLSGSATPAPCTAARRTPGRKATWAGTPRRPELRHLDRAPRLSTVHAPVVGSRGCEILTLPLGNSPANGSPYSGAAHRPRARGKGRDRRADHRALRRARSLPSSPTALVPQACLRHLPQGPLHAGPPVGGANYDKFRSPTTLVK